MKSIILDLDGTISDHSPRFHLAQAKLWDEYHARCNEDLPHEDVLGLIDMIFNPALAPLVDPVDLVICTGRSEKYRSVTMDWLRKHRIPVQTILMRGGNDFRKSGVIKAELLEEHFGSKEEVIKQVLFVLEDRESLVQFFRDYGLPCWQVRNGGA